jgi:hypothetical protein
MFHPDFAPPVVRGAVGLKLRLTYSLPEKCGIQ